MVEAFDRCARYREGVGLSAEPLSTLPERDLMPLLRQAEGGGQPGDAAADDGDARAVSRRSGVVSCSARLVALESRLVVRLASRFGLTTYDSRLPTR